MQVCVHYFLPHDAMHKHGLCCCVVSITFVYSVKMSRHIFKIFSLQGSHTILVIPCQPNVVIILMGTP